MATLEKRSVSTTGTSEGGSGRDTRLNACLRTRDVMAALEAQINQDYQSSLVETVRRAGGTIAAGGVTVRFAKIFGFCYGVQRAIDLAYATRKVFPTESIYLLGEIIHNPWVNSRLAALGIRNLLRPGEPTRLEDLQPQDIVIIPAFGAELGAIKRLEDRGCRIVDTTCGDVMSVWKRVRHNASRAVTTIIHGNLRHEETRATISRACAKGGHYLVVAGLPETDIVCHYIRHGGNKVEFLEKFSDAYSSGFEPDVHLNVIGVANQTTMLSSETQEVQQRLRAAIGERDGGFQNFNAFDGICRATQERQDSLYDLLEGHVDLLLIVGGYNSSNTTHLAEIGGRHVPTYFIDDASCLLSPKAIRHFDWRLRRQLIAEQWLPDREVCVGVTAGASCPESLVEKTIKRLFAIRGVDLESLSSSNVTPTLAPFADQKL